jgi:hypothetical protein
MRQKAAGDRPHFPQTGFLRKSSATAENVSRFDKARFNPRY